MKKEYENTVAKEVLDIIVCSINCVFNQVCVQSSVCSINCVFNQLCVQSKYQTYRFTLQMLQEDRSHH